MTGSAAFQAAGRWELFRALGAIAGDPAERRHGVRGSRLGRAG